MTTHVVNESTVVLAIETSCDETAASVVMGGNDILSSIVSSQIEIHARFGGVVPEVASRAHLEALIPVVNAAITEAGILMTPHCSFHWWCYWCRVVPPGLLKCVAMVIT